MQQTEDNTQ